ncbi:MAG: hypothetical protein E7334_09160, partial [Clostridiales bacterium]|nr:hypothetical protein [Clostridiales bacterium]
MKLLDGGDRAKFDTPGDIEKSIESLASKETKRTARVSSCARFSFMLKRIYKSLDKTQASFPAALWLTDNFPLLEEAYFYINDRRKYRLPSADGLVSRAEEFADIIAQNSEKALDFESFSKYINVFQSNSYFSQDELWLLPKLITAAFFRRACRIGADIARINDQRSLAFRMISKDLDINRIAAHSKDVYFLEHAYNLLRDTKPEAALSLINRLGISQEDIDEKINLTISLLSKLEISISACIDSIRNISKLDWTEKYEAFNCIDKILCAEKAGVYVKTDFLSRQAVRSEISRFAKRHNMSETSTAHAVVSAADRYARDISSMLFGSGKSELLKTLSKTEPKEPNMIFLYMFLTALVSVASSIIIVLTQKFYLALTLLQIVWALSIYVITRAFTAFIKPKRLLRYDYSSGI